MRALHGKRLLQRAVAESRQARCSCKPVELPNSDDYGLIYIRRRASPACGLSGPTWGAGLMAAWVFRSARQNLGGQQARLQVSEQRQQRQRNNNNNNHNPNNNINNP